MTQVPENFREELLDRWTDLALAEANRISTLLLLEA